MTGGQRKSLLGLVAQLNQYKTELCKKKKGLKTMLKPNQWPERGLNLACVQPYPPLKQKGRLSSDDGMQ